MTDQPLDPAAAIAQHVTQLGANKYGTPISIHTCTACGDEFTVCPPITVERWGTGCLAEECPTYDINRDVGLFWDALMDHNQIKRI